ncbi:MAG TPA: hypothetical protein VM008_01325 [Phycisphaerae bacterium]|nr:hypothetical protein [Phycisphaerae bacterium]
MSWTIRGSLGLAVVAVFVTAAVATVTVTPLEEKPATPPTSQAAAAAPQGGPASQPADATLSLENLNGLIDAQKYREALQLIMRMMPMPGFDRAQLLMLRAECQLQIHESSSAVATLLEASRSATAANNTVQAYDAAAFAVLIQKSAPRNIYTPLNSPEKAPIDILNRAKRKSAYQALLVDSIVTLQAKLRSASANGALPPFIDIAHDIPALKGIERNANGGTKQADQFAKDAANAAAKVITTSLADMDAHIAQIAASADRLVTTGGSGYGSTYNNANTYRHQGLTQDEVQSLESIENTCARIPAAVTQLTKAFENPEPFFHLATRAQTTANRAHTVRTKDYNQP